MALSFSPKKIKNSSTGKKVPCWQFFRTGWDGRAPLGWPTRIPHRSWKTWMPMNIYKDWKAKWESAYSFMLKYFKITVLIHCAYSVPAWTWSKLIALVCAHRTFYDQSNRCNAISIWIFHIVLCFRITKMSKPIFRWA